MFSICASNFSRGVKEASFYEIGKTYFPKSLPMTDTAIEKETLVIGVYGEKEDFYSLKSIVEALADRFNVTMDFVPSNEPFLHPYRQAFVKINSKAAGYLGQLHPAVTKTRKFDPALYIAEIDLDVFIENTSDFLPFVPVSKFPSIQRDLAFVVDKDVYAGEMLKTIEKVGGKYLRQASVFDVYTGVGVLPGKKSIAFNLLFRKDDGTLDGEEVNQAVDAVLTAMAESFGAKLRD
jgi:phenylalanyl-tRNA synthetase beta chain